MGVNHGSGANEMCATCDGSGRYNWTGVGADGYDRCPDCNGTGQQHESDQSRYASDCSACETDGTAHQWECPNHPRHDTRTEPSGATGGRVRLRKLARMYREAQP